MTKRNIVEIDEEKCNGCGLCVPNCHEGAIQIVEGKAKLVKEQYCDGLGNCLGHCPQDAIKIIEKDVDEFNFEATNAHLKNMGKEELKENPMKKEEKLPCGCPGTALKSIEKKPVSNTAAYKQPSELTQWPVQLSLLPPQAPFFDNSDLLVSADCVPFSNANFHSEILKGKSIVVGCPKLDNIEAYTEKLTDIIKLNNIKSITVAIMEVPCCSGMAHAVESAVSASGKDVPVKNIVLGLNGEVIN